ncbi:membrane peptidoglycan carboxypeptidase [Stackebrandtia endophytica]|uniref:Membrane peptidoglycan carboxypeptidase n=1 Tax=Stackebrandtia endophytica TaxID=1496996 RepID=A0A543AZ71_9ACTN|nr:transglycosylase domain-containing protein [Stackebrandtia endophytica]TQL77873.1 membrane peptidoglycan carboxypeptidase [Stackebrandtia endophytica]
MSDYGSRGYGRDPDDYGWPGKDGGGRSDSGRRDYGGTDNGYGSSGYGSSNHGGYGSSDQGSSDGYGSSAGGRDSYGSGGYGSSSSASGHGSDSYGSSSSSAYGSDSYGSSSSGGYGSDSHASSSSDYGTDSRRSSGYESGGYGGDHDEPPTTGRARVPGGDSTGPGRARGSARVGDRPGRGRALSDEEAEAMAKAKKKKKRRRRLIAAACVMTVMLGMIVVAGSWYFQTVPLPIEDINRALAQNSTITYADGSSMAKIGEANRVEVKYDDIPEEVVYSLVAGEDAKFFEHGGVDFWGVMRALWNNVTGGETQGASTLTQQYIGQVMDIRGDQSYMRKANEAVMAMKLDEKYSKQQIIEFYLNLVYMGRGAYGLGAAVTAWYGEDQKLEDLTASQAALIFAQVKSPNGRNDPRNTCEPCELSDEQAVANAEERWAYFLKAQFEMGELSKEKYEQYIADGLPETAETTAVSPSEGFDKHTGFVSHKYVVEEAARKAGISQEQLMVGGYKITTTLNKQAQQAAVNIASRKDGSTMDQLDPTGDLRAALVSIDPKTGEVLAYFGGTTNGTGTDKAGYENMHPPGSSFKEFTMLTALKNNVSVDSMWDGSSPMEFETRVDGNGDKLPVTNSGNRSVERISLTDTMVQSLNTPIFAMTEMFGANQVMLTAYAMGITRVAVHGDTYNLNDPDTMALLQDDDYPRQVVDNEIGFGQYPVSVFDMAVANATLANYGVYNEPHFIKEIVDAEGNVVYSAEGNIERREAVPEGVARDAVWVSSQIHPNDGNGTTPSNVRTAGKTGTWERTCEENNPGCGQNSHLWYTGFSQNVSAAVWVGHKSSENGDVRDQWGSPDYGAGMSGSVWQAYMNEVTQLEGFNDPKPFLEPVKGGDPNAGNAKEEEKKDDDEDDERPGDDENCPGNNPNCNNGENPGQQHCDPGSPGQWPDCNADGICDPEFSECFPNGECDPNFPMDPDCGGENENQEQNNRITPYELSTRDHDRPFAVREEQLLLT